ncbi:hypothetical protein Btru_050209 [Bulinus truncatus]|nr:hypothetical protein Btru_050209 [Bulinus truncatus]
MPFNCCRIQVSDKETEQGQKDELHKVYESIRTCDDQALTKLKNFINKYKNDIFQFDRFRYFKFHSKTEGDLTLIHAAALYHNDCSIVQILAEMFPELIPVERTGTYQGQTALHITVGKGRHQSTKHILENARDNDIEKMFSARATGRRCTSSIMLGETPLSVAFLTFDIEMVKLLLKYGAKLNEVNSKGDTIIHSLIKFAAIDKGKISKVIQMLNYFTNKINKRNKSDKMVSKTDEKETLQQMWFKENNELVTPLKLAVSAGLAEVFDAMLKMENVFYFPNTRDGSFDTRYYDVTEIDPNAHFKIYHRQTEKIILGDLIRFGLIIVLVFTSFTFAMYISIPHKNEVEQFSNFKNTTMTMFVLMLVLKEMDFLDEVDSQSQRLVAVIYVLFIITTYILLISSLIAMMSKTFVIENDERKMIARLQRSSVTLFLNPFMCGYHLNEKTEF